MSQYGFSDDGFVDVDENYSSLGFNHLVHAPGYAPVVPRFDFKNHTDAMIFQICPRVQDGHELPPAIVRNGETIPTGWFQRVPIVTCGSMDRVSFIAFDPGEEKRGKIAARDNPYMVLRKRVQSAVNTKVHEGWASLLKGNQDVAIPALSDKYFVQGIVWTDGKQRLIENERPMGLRPQDKELALIRMSKTGIESIRAAVLGGFASGVETISLGIPKYFGLANRKKFSNLLAKVSWEEFQKSQKFGNNAAVYDGAAALASLSSATTASDEEDEWEGYAAAMTDIALIAEKGQPLGSLPGLNWEQYGYAAECRRKWRPWSEIFRIMDDQEQAVHIARSLADHPAVLQYAWGDTCYWTEDVKGILRNRTVISGATSRLDDSVGAPAAGGGFTMPGAAAAAAFGVNPHGGVQSVAPSPSVLGGFTPPAPTPTPAPANQTVNMSPTNPNSAVAGADGLASMFGGGTN